MKSLNFEKMKAITTVLILLFCANFAFAQGVKKEVENGIFVEFPNTPDYYVNQGSPVYTAVTESVICMVIIQRDMIPFYAQFALEEKNWTEKEKKEIRDVLLDNAVKGALDYTGSAGNSQEIKIGNYYGRKINYTAINPVTGKRGERYGVILSVRDRLILFECFLMNESSKAIEEKNKFINSISSYK
ncbi:hypothetical protein LJB78_00965 [Bacteroidales bacterium OttesenSCG-928-J16]|nr:hypothetical protein [Bacteroidales bacterium OttesenSCG-928-J16]